MHLDKRLEEATERSAMYYVGWGFFVAGYESRFWFWEAVVCTRKAQSPIAGLPRQPSTALNAQALLYMVFSLAPSSAESALQNVLLLFIVVAALSAHVYYQPYEVPAPRALQQPAECWPLCRTSAWTASRCGASPQRASRTCCRPS